MRKYFLFIIPILFFACSIEKKASKSFENAEYQEAINKYSSLIEKEPENPRYYLFIAEAYRKSNRPHQSVPYYEKAISGGIDEDSVRLNYAYALKTTMDYTSSRNQLQYVASNSNNDDYLALANDALQDLDRLEYLKEKNSYFRVKNLDDINTESPEYSPVYNDGFLYFTSNRTADKIFKGTGTPFTDVFRVKTYGANVDNSTVEPLDDIINEEGINEGSVTFTPDGRTMVFAKGNSGKKKGTADVNLYITRYRNGQWSEPRMLNINNPGYWDSTPAFSRNGRTLYFASNRPGGQGGTDIYSANMDARGRFTNVKNLGPQINTPRNEMFPYVSDEGHLYFSSDGHPGFGALDLFVAKRVNGKISIENMGEPVNSNMDDFGIYLFKADRGFFTSNRTGGKGDDDIYTFINQDPDLKIINYFLEGVTMTREDENGELSILPRVQVKLLDYTGEVLDETVTEEDGKFNFRVYEHERYTLIGEKVGDAENYFVTRVPFTTVGRAANRDTLTQLVTDITYDTLLVLDKIEKNKVFVLENIYYDFNKYDIRPDAAQELDKLVTILEDNPHIKIELSSHTDSVATERYNLMLSQKRAESAVEYIVSQGISPSRLLAKGYGESRPIAPNTNPDGTDNPEGRQKNRRTEFRIIDVAARPNKEFNEDKYFNDDGEGS